MPDDRYLTEKLSKRKGIGHEPRMRSGRSDSNKHH